MADIITESGLSAGAIYGYFGGGKQELFVAVADQPVAALSVIGASAASDLLDGWTARHTGHVTHFGAILDPLTDKWFVACVIGALVANGKLPPIGVLALMTREIAELPLALHELRKRAEGRPHVERPMAVRARKIATALQFASISFWARCISLAATCSAAGASTKK